MRFASLKPGSENHVLECGSGGSGKTEDLERRKNSSRERDSSRIRKMKSIMDYQEELDVAEREIKRLSDLLNAYTAAESKANNKTPRKHNINKTKSSPCSDLTSLKEENLALQERVKTLSEENKKLKSENAKLNNMAASNIMEKLSKTRNRSKGGSKEEKLKRQDAETNLSNGNNSSNCFKPLLRPGRKPTQDSVKNQSTFADRSNLVESVTGMGTLPSSVSPKKKDDPKCDTTTTTLFYPDTTSKLESGRETIQICPEHDDRSASQSSLKGLIDKFNTISSEGSSSSSSSSGLGGGISSIGGEKRRPSDQLLVTCREQSRSPLAEENSSVSELMVEDGRSNASEEGGGPRTTLPPGLMLGKNSATGKKNMLKCCVGNSSPEKSAKKSRGSGSKKESSSHRLKISKSSKPDLLEGGSAMRSAIESNKHSKSPKSRKDGVFFFNKCG